MFEEPDIWYVLISWALVGGLMCFAVALPCKHERKKRDEE